MKVSPLILSFIVLVLSVSPCCTEGDCIDEQKTTQDASHQDECNSCSPFLSCGSCTGFTPASTTITRPVCFFEHPCNHISVSEPVPETQHNKIWQPPRMG